jgi:hypothetical protein
MLHACASAATIIAYRRTPRRAPPQLRDIVCVFVVGMNRPFRREHSQAEHYTERRLPHGYALHGLLAEPRARCHRGENGNGRRSQRRTVTFRFCSLLFYMLEKQQMARRKTGVVRVRNRRPPPPE